MDVRAGYKSLVRYWQPVVQVRDETRVGKPTTGTRVGNHSVTAGFRRTGTLEIQRPSHSGNDILWLFWTSFRCPSLQPTERHAKERK